MLLVDIVWDLAAISAEVSTIPGGCPSSSEFSSSLITSSWSLLKISHHQPRLRVVPVLGTFRYSLVNYSLSCSAMGTQWCHVAVSFQLCNHNCTISWKTVTPLKLKPFFRKCAILVAHLTKKDKNNCTISSKLKNGSNCATVCNG